MWWKIRNVQRRNSYVIHKENSNNFVFILGIPKQTENWPFCHESKYVGPECILVQHKNTNSETINTQVYRIMLLQLWYLHFIVYNNNQTMHWFHKFLISNIILFSLILILPHYLNKGDEDSYIMELIHHVSNNIYLKCIWMLCIRWLHTKYTTLIL